MEKGVEEKRYVFVGKTLFFPKEKIVCIGDLHLGYEKMLRNQGLSIPLEQFKNLIKELEQTFIYIKEKYGKIEKIVLLGDIKHHFSFDYEENKELLQLLGFLKKYVEEKNIVFIKGNHERNTNNGKYLDYYVLRDIAFVHGDRVYSEIYDKEVNMVVMGHLHPSITLRDEMKIKNEKYKCFLVGRYNKKDFVIVPSFLNLTEGVAANEIDEMMDNSFSIIPNNELDNFEIFIVQEPEKKALDFGRLRDLE
jgi:putative SbcD/Mre11-related phosphoesterase